MHTEPNVPKFSPEIDKAPSQGSPDERQVPESETESQSAKILVVDDTLPWLRLAQEILLEGGYQVQVCDDPAAAVSLLTENPEQFDLVITDLYMPGFTGIELAAELRMINAALPIVLTSSAMVELSPAKLQALGFRGFLTKPWQIERLSSLVGQMLANPVRKRRNGQTGGAVQ
jgi:CheY-like chemotaxis protein